jgi:uncharacterized radical SAM superfamily Fe-S cluster-containing enzyme
MITDRAKSLAQAALTSAARAAWPLARRVNRIVGENTFRPRWAGGRALEKHREKSFPPLGLPRETDSLCPQCVREVRARVLAAIERGEGDLDLLRGDAGLVRAVIREDAGAVVMEKRCPAHGLFRDVLATDAAFFLRLERLYPGRDFAIAADALHDHGRSSIRYGRGAVLTIDLTNRCNMMCDPCFMDANQVGYVHELTLDDVKKILDDAISVEPRRQLSVQFSGGEPTMSPHFLEACRYARAKGYFSVQCASNGIRFAQDPEFCRAAKEAGLRFVYLQFDGTSEGTNAHRGVGNLFEVKRRALENIHGALMSAALVVTVVNGVNSEEVGPIVRFAIEHADMLHTVSFQPVSFTGRDEDLPEDRRRAWRYTLSQLAHDLRRQLGATEPLRDWFPLSASAPISDLADLVAGPAADWGALKCGCHPNCGIGTFLLVDVPARRASPVPEFLDLEGFIEDVKEIVDAARGPAATKALAALALLRRFEPKKAPGGFTLLDLAALFGEKTGARAGGARGAARWKLLFVGGMWFQDLFNYDFRRTEMCVIPYATQLGEISFCAYNTGLGWRQIVEKMFQFGSVNRWYRENGRHEIFARGRAVPLPPAPAPGATLRGEWERGEVALVPAAGGGGTDVVYKDGARAKAPEAPRDESARGGEKRPKPLPIVDADVLARAAACGRRSP